MLIFSPELYILMCMSIYCMSILQFLHFYFLKAGKLDTQASGCGKYKRSTDAH